MSNTTVVETHSATVVNVSNTDFIVQGSGVTMTFIGGSNDSVGFPHQTSDRVIATNTTNLAVNASTTDDLSVVVRGAAVGMQIGGWGNFATGETLTLVGQGNCTLSFIGDNGALISGLHPHHHGSIMFSDSHLQPSQIIALG
jgi:hypothetical protein